MSWRRFVIMLFVSFLFLGCSRYDYYPAGIKHEDKKKPISANTSSYIVQKGDTLYSIGRKYRVDFKALAKRNSIRKPYEIYVGQRIYFKGKAGASYSSYKPQKPKTYATKKPSKKGKAKKYPQASFGKVKLKWPVQGRLSSKFGPRKNRMHDGIDIAAKKGTHIFAAASGRVVYADSRLSGYGNLIIVRHNTNVFTAYAHNQKNLVVKGQSVKIGQHIANVGATGRATGPHLHFEVRRGETAVDPLLYLPKR